MWIMIIKVIPESSGVSELTGAQEGKRVEAGRGQILGRACIFRGLSDKEAQVLADEEQAYWVEK